MSPKNSNLKDPYFDLVTRLTKIDNNKKMTKFLEALLTSQERKSITKRLQIYKMLELGVPQAKIAKELGVGIATVTHGSRELKSNNFRYE